MTLVHSPSCPRAVVARGSLPSLLVLLLAASHAAASEIKLLASDGGASDLFGTSVAIGGGFAVAGAPGHDGSGSNSGSAYVYVDVGPAWSEQAILLASDGATGDNFGRAVAIDEDTVVVGALAAAYVFQRSGTTWSQQVKLTASDGDFWGSGFGQAVSISGDTVVVENWFDDVQTGSAYVFVRSGTTWSQQAKLVASDGTPNALFAWSVSVSGDTVACGSDRDDDRGEKAGAVYVYVRSGTAWTEQAKLTASDGAPGDHFAWSVAVDGDAAVIGARLDDDNSMSSGSAYFFVRNGTTWSEQTKLTPSDGAPLAFFGGTVDLDGGDVLIGSEADGEAGTYAGAAYLYDPTSRWSDLGGGTTGIGGDPTLLASGPLTPGSVARFDLSNAPPDVLMLAWLSFTSTPVASSGGRSTRSRPTPSCCA